MGWLLLTCAVVRPARVPLTAALSVVLVEEEADRAALQAKAEKRVRALCVCFNAVWRHSDWSGRAAVIG